jgi:excisionase family DNA binding protein
MGRESQDLQILAREIAEQLKSLLKADEYPPILTVAQAAKMTQLDQHTVYELIRQGKIPAFKAGRVLRISRDKLLDLVAAGEHEEWQPKARLKIAK